MATRFEKQRGGGEREKTFANSAEKQFIFIFGGLGVYQRKDLQLVTFWFMCRMVKTRKSARAYLLRILYIIINYMGNEKMRFTNLEGIAALLRRSIWSLCLIIIHTEIVFCHINWVIIVNRHDMESYNIWYIRQKVYRFTSIL